MNKKTLSSFIAFAATFALGLVAMQLMLLLDISKWIGVTVGIVVLIISLFLFCITKKRPKACIAAMFFNALAGGITASSLFVHLGYAPKIWESAACFGCIAAAFLVFCLLTYIKPLSYHPVIYTVCFSAVYLAALIALTVCYDAGAVFVLAWLFSIIFIAYIISTAIEADGMKAHFKTLAYCSYAILAIIIVVVLTVLADGDIGFAPDGIGGSLGREKRNHFTFNA